MYVLSCFANEFHIEMLIYKPNTFSLFRLIGSWLKLFSINIVAVLMFYKVNLEFKKIDDSVNIFDYQSIVRGVIC